MRFPSTWLIGALLLSGCIDAPEFKLLPDSASDAGPATVGAVGAEAEVSAADGGTPASAQALAPDGGPGRKPYVFDGAYTTTLTNGANACALPGWTEGAVETVTIRYKRDGASRASAIVEGLSAIRIGGLVGGVELSGAATASSVTLARASKKEEDKEEEKEEKDGKCGTAWRVRMTSEFEGSTAVGKIFYEQISTKSDCPPILCTNVQTTRGTKLP